METMGAAKPKTRISRGWIAVGQPADRRASRSVIRAIGISSRADLGRAEPADQLRVEHEGTAIAVTVKPITEIATLASEKLRSRKRPSGTSGSRVLRAARARTAPRTASPGDDQRP